MKLMKNNYLIDIDGTICEDIPNEEMHRMIDAEPFEGAINAINKLYDEGHNITFFTSRTTVIHRYITERWLNKHEFKYHALLMDKPRHGHYVWIDNLDVQGVKFTGEWNEKTLNTPPIFDTKYMVFKLEGESWEQESIQLYDLEKATKFKESCEKRGGTFMVCQIIG